MIRNYDLQAIFFSVCIVTFRRQILLQNCLACIAPSRQTLDPSLYDVIISDDCSEQSARPVTEKCGFARWIQGPCQGIAANRNHVAGSAIGDWIVFVDDDECPEPDWLENFYHAAQTGKWDVLQGRVEPVDYPDSLLWYAPRVSSGVSFCTANLAIRRQALFQLGGFDERLRVSHEDVELGARIHKSGLRSAFIGDALVLHPARRISLSQAWNVLIQQQCQSFELQHRDGRFGFSKSPNLIYILIWSLRFFVRTFRLEMAYRLPGHWRRPIQSILLRLVVSPLAILKIRYATDLQVLANQQ
jgi:GT2 family glycosyltransferase